MNEIWANRIIAGTKAWADLPTARREAVKAILAERVSAGGITPERYAEITGEELAG